MAGNRKYFWLALGHCALALAAGAGGIGCVVAYMRGRPPELRWAAASVAFLLIAACLMIMARWFLERDKNG